MNAAMTTDLNVNGQACRTTSAPNTPLLYVLRDELGLTAAKFGCGQGHCGACTVHVNGRAQQACDTPLWSVAGAVVTTLEGLEGPDGELDAVQQAFARHGAIQCGYCIPGIVMTVKALRTHEPAAGPERIRAVLAERHLCRCGTHTRILAAVQACFPAP